MRRAGPILIVVAALTSTACRGRRGDERSQMEIALAAADRLYDQRVDEQKLREAQQAYLDVLAENPDEPEVLWRLSRAYTAFAYGYPDAPADTCGSPGVADPALCYTLALEYAFRCMEANSAWTSRLALNDGYISKRVAASLGAREIPCMNEGIQAWTRWTASRGPSAALYLDSISWLSRRLAELNGEEGGPEWVSAWGAGMSEALAPAAMQPDTEAAAVSFETAVSLADELATPRVDRVIYLLARTDASSTQLLREEAERIRADFPTDVSHPWALENRRALERLESLTGEGTDPLP